MAVDPRVALAAVAVALAPLAARGALPAPGPAAGPPVGTAAKPARIATKAVSTHAWHDGASRRDLTLEPGLIADFSPSVASGPVLRPASVQDSVPAVFSSPVLRDDAGRLRALPGGVLLVLSAPLDDAAAQALLQRAGVARAQRLGATLWRVDGPAGLASLELANRLHATGLFAAAQPNWWIARTTK